MTRRAEVKRKTKETDIRVAIELDGAGAVRVQTGIGFLDHMLDLFARHGLFDLEVECRGDLNIDDHHSVEDIAICLGQAFAEALGDKRGIVRFGSAYVPMDETLARAVADLSGRSYMVYRVENTRDRIGDFSTELAEHFWHSFAEHARCNLHIEVFYGRNQHHILEAVFKSAARALSQAVRLDARIEGVMSTKGVL
ncbi:MAG: imidazoleglycerol-phosphate dehydratase HisB [Acidobacteria bacterium]|nr:imidazoleglycerol-phosphate dehydratase HisB [Acidobacteriota bacterium]MCW5971080.1 imidazoleglycerol-phosphate dehydratase HisB [Blastocatellales bacterium]